MKLFLKNTVIILIGTLGLASVLSFGSLWSLRHSSYYKPSFLVNACEADAYDYIIVGASTGLTTLNTCVIDSIADVKGLNLSLEDSGLSTHYMMLQHFLAQGKTTTYCILAPSNTSYDLKDNVLSDNDYRFLPFVNEPYVYDHYRQYETEQANVLRSSKWLPMIGVSYYNTELFFPSLLGIFNPNKRHRFDATGNYAYPPKNIHDKPIMERDPFEVDFSNPYMAAIQKLCDQHNIQLICYFAPMERRRAKVVNRDYSVINHSAYLTNTRYFYDEIHVNSLGREVASLAFAERFVAIMDGSEGGSE